MTFFYSGIRMRFLTIKCHLPTTKYIGGGLWQTPPNLDQKIVECVDAGLQAFGKSAKHIVYYCLERDFRLKKNEIPERLKPFPRQ
ncbi:MAG: hypothetical protein DRO00_10055 [Thermoproteota archaeon]|nr:MAG: hypothetical protein DRO00_10055 [Candidatus Korarchaeota archaeon]